MRSKPLVPMGPPTPRRCKLGWLLGVKPNPSSGGTEGPLGNEEEKCRLKQYDSLPLNSQRNRPHGVNKPSPYGRLLYGPEKQNRLYTSKNNLKLLPKTTVVHRKKTPGKNPAENPTILPLFYQGETGGFSWFFSWRSFSSSSEGAQKAAM